MLKIGIDDVQKSSVSRRLQVTSMGTELNRRYRYGTGRKPSKGQVSK